MREAAFIKKNQKRWEEFENILKTNPNNKAKLNPDSLAELFVQVTDDLAFSRTYYPDSQTTVYLNSLASHLHQAIYKNKRENKNRWLSFWKIEMPLLFRTAHRELLVAFSIFGLAVLIGVVSSAHDENFPRLILGDQYINMTLQNIEKNDPMAVYKDANQLDMFMGITLNNVLVSFRTFAGGIATSLVTAWILLMNGIMLGTFQYFFYAKGLFITSFLTIWIHGTLEISAIVIAGAAGIVMGNGLLFPQTYSRFESFRMAAKRGLKITLGLVPIFVLAGFLESFVTRLTEMPDVLKVAIIGGSAYFIVFYFIVYPIRLHRKHGYDQENEL
jgi:uncharacterized membrane protein SpoIIM required for sporulation